MILKKSTVDEQLAVLCSSRLLNSIIIDDYVTAGLTLLTNTFCVNFQFRQEA